MVLQILPDFVEKGGDTRDLKTAFMHRLWRTGRGRSIRHALRGGQVDRFSPRSKAILEIQAGGTWRSWRNLLDSVLLGDDGPEGWGIEYATEFHMTNDSKLFPPRPKWEADGYQPDEYSRWIKGNWRPIEELWRELGVAPSHVVPIDLNIARAAWRRRTCSEPTGGSAARSPLTTTFRFPAQTFRQGSFSPATAISG